MPERGRKRALVTGGTRRLGRAIVEGLAAHAFDVAVHYRSDESGAREVLDALRAAGAEGVALQADLAEPEACGRLVEAAEDALGGLDLLVNNAAIFERTPLDTMNADDFDRHWNANARSVYLLTLDAGRRMKARGRGVVVNIADTAGLRPWPAFIPYSASKAAVVSLTLGFARALAPEVRVNAIAPGPMLPPAGTSPEQGEKAVAGTLLKRWGEPRDIADAVVYLATAPYVTGVVLPVDGGRSLT